MLKKNMVKVNTITDFELEKGIVFDNESVRRGYAKILWINRVIHPDHHVVQLTMYDFSGKKHLNYESGLVYPNYIGDAETFISMSGQTYLSRSWWRDVDFELAINLIPKNWHEYRVHVIERMLHGVILADDYWRDWRSIDGENGTTIGNPYQDYHAFTTGD